MELRSLVEELTEGIEVLFKQSSDSEESTELKVEPSVFALMTDSRSIRADAKSFNAKHGLNFDNPSIEPFHHPGCLNDNEEIGAMATEEAPAWLG